MFSRQVSNRSGCIKIAYDFLNLPNVSASQKITQEFWAERRDDVLACDSMLYHASVALDQLLSDPATAEEPERSVENKKRKKNQEHKKSPAGQADQSRRKRAKRIAEGKVTVAEDSKRFCLLCPHASCSGSPRLFEFNGLFGHLYV
jgi:hypothetical protein